MRNLVPTFLVALFICAVALRAGHMGYDFVQESMNLYAAEDTSENMPKDAEMQKKDTPRSVKTVRKKILETDVINKDMPVFATKVARSTDDTSVDQVCITGPMLKKASKQLAYLEAREAQILEQQRLLESSDRRVREQIAKLKLINNNIIESAKLADSKIQKESKRLISMYEKMDAKRAAKIFNQMSPEVAAELLRTMKEDQSSAILASMDPKAAYQITLSLAGGIKKTRETYGKVRDE